MTKEAKVGRAVGVIELLAFSKVIRVIFLKKGKMRVTILNKFQKTGQGKILGTPNYPFFSIHSIYIYINFLKHIKRSVV
jgi:hypothetical protein